MEKISVISLPSFAKTNENSICRFEVDERSMSLPASMPPAPSITSYQRAVSAAVNYTKHIAIDEDAQLHLIHLLFCLEQALVTN